MSKLIIAEKPSVAQSIAKVLGATSRKEGYIEGGNYIVTWCVGHLAAMANAEVYDEKYAKWRYDDLLNKIVRICLLICAKNQIKPQ